MKQLLIIIAAVVLVGCGALENYEGKYFFEFDNVKTNVELKQNSVVTLQEGIDKPKVGNWSIKGGLIIINFTNDEHDRVLIFNKKSFKLAKFLHDGKDLTVAMKDYNNKDIILKKF